MAIFFRSMKNKPTARFGFCDIQNNQGLGKGYQPPADNPYLDLDYSGYQIKTSCNNCLSYAVSSYVSDCRTERAIKVQR